MKIVQVLSAYTAFTYYGTPTETTTITTFVSDELSPEEIEIAKENARLKLEYETGKWWRAKVPGSLF